MLTSKMDSAYMWSIETGTTRAPHKMTISLELRQAFNFHRGNGRSAYVALDKARHDVISNTRRYSSSPWRKFCGNGARTERGAQWIESPANVGLRFVGFCDSIDSHIGHTGWFTDAYQDDQIRGVVFQLPGRGGKARFVAGHDNADNGAADNGGAAFIDWSEIFESEREDYSFGGYDHPGAAHEAARAADEFTRVEAEHAQEYNRAWQAGFRWAEVGEEIAADRANVRALLAERREAKADGKSYPTICATLERAIRNALGDIADGREKRATLAAGDYSQGETYLGFFVRDKNMVAAFNDGAGQQVLA